MNSQYQKVIREANMAYLNMAQKFIRQDMKSALEILGMSQDAAELIMNLSEGQKNKYRCKRDFAVPLWRDG